jgi:hypothetical protein
MGKKGLLPRGYTQVEYIENTNDSAYIDTLVNAGDIGSMTSRMCYNTEPNINIGDGAVETNWWMMVGFILVSNKGYYGGQYGAGSTEVGVVGWDGAGWHTLTLTLRGNRGSITVDDKSKALVTANPSENNTIWLFMRSGATIRKFTSKRGIVELYDKNNQPLRYFVPCINPKNVVGMYDTVEGKFYSSPNGVAFVAGPVV